MSNKRCWWAAATQKKTLKKEVFHLLKGPPLLVAPLSPTCSIWKLGFCFQRRQQVQIPEVCRIPTWMVWACWSGEAVHFGHIYYLAVPPSGGHPRSTLIIVRSCQMNKHTHNTPIYRLHAQPSVMIYIHTLCCIHICI